MRSARPVHKRRRRSSEEEDNPSNGTIVDLHIQTLPSSTSDSQSKQESEPVSVSESESEDEEQKISDITNINNTSKEEAEDNVEDNEDEEREEMTNRNQRKKEKEKVLYRFPMHRVQKIVRSEGTDDLRVGQEAVFVINKASEKFLELFCEDAYAASVQDNKNYVAYKHLSSTVCKQRRFDFLSDFIPEKVKAEDALEERKLAGI